VNYLPNPTFVRVALTHMSNNNDDDRRAPHTDRSAERSYTDVPWFHRLGIRQGWRRYTVRSQVLMFKLISFTWITRASTESPIIIAVSTWLSYCHNGTLTPLSVLPRSDPLAKLRLLSKKHHPWEVLSPDRDYCLHLRHSQNHVKCQCYPGMLVRRQLIIWLCHSSIRSCLYT